MIEMIVAMIAMGMISAGITGLQNYENNKFIEEQNLLNKQWEDERNQLSIDETINAREWSSQQRATEIQTRMADAEAAGVNPLYAIGGNSTTPTVVAPQLNSAQAQAKSLDLSGLTNMVQSMTSLMLTHKLINSGKQADLLQAKTDMYNEKSIGQVLKNNAFGQSNQSTIALNSAKENYYNEKVAIMKNYLKKIKSEESKEPKWLKGNLKKLLDSVEDL